MKPLFSNKVRSNACITLNEEEKLIKNEYEIANIFNTFFIEIAPNLGTKVDERYLCDASNISDPTEKAIQKYKNHLKDIKKDFVYPTHKRDFSKKSNYRPISILSNLSKIHKRLLDDQMFPYFSNFSPQYQWGFCKGYSAQHCLLNSAQHCNDCKNERIPR